VPGGKNGPREAKNSGRYESLPLLSAPMGIVLLLFVNITIECVGVIIEVQAQKIYQYKWE